jgi:hypothetical protein
LKISEFKNIRSESVYCKYKNFRVKSCKIIYLYALITVYLLIFPYTLHINISLNTLIEKSFNFSRVLSTDSGLLFAQEGYRGRPYFQEAYSLEKSDPLKAAEIYKKALDYGLDDKMRSAAIWRIYHLYKSNKRYSSAYLMLPKLGSGQGTGKIRSDLISDMMYAWKVDSGTLDIYLNGLTSLASHGKSDYRSSLQSAVSRTPGNSVFHQEIADRLIEYGHQDEAFSVIRQSDSTAPSSLLMEADYMISQSRLNEAEAILRKSSVNSSSLTSAADKFQILYLLGKIERERNNIYESVMYYRIAAQYASGEEQNKQVFLAAFGIYKAGYPSQAYALIYRLPESSDFNMNLLSLVLKAQVAGDQSSLAKLVSREKELKDYKNQNGASFLVDQALQLIKRKAQS